MERLLPALALPEGPLDLIALFPQMRHFALEVGFGGGEHLIVEARRRPDGLFIGCEPFINGMAQMLAHIDDEGLTNLRLYGGDARDILERLAAAQLDALFVHFPDPWPKKRHWKRRFIGTDTVPLLAHVLKAGALLRVASDSTDYVRWTLAHLSRSAKFEWLAQAPADWREPPSGWVSTRYEQKAIREGRTPHYLTFHRTALS